MKELIEKLLIKHEAKLIHENIVDSAAVKLNKYCRSMVLSNGIGFIVTEENRNNGNLPTHYEFELYPDSVIDALGNGELNFEMDRLDKCLEIIDLYQMQFGYDAVGYSNLALLGKFKDSFFENDGIRDVVSIPFILTPDSHVIELMREAGLFNAIIQLDGYDVNNGAEWRDKYPALALYVHRASRELYRFATNYTD